MEKATSRVISAKICSGSPASSASMVGSTEPSMEFSSGTQAKSASPLRIAASAAGVLSTGTGSTVGAPGISPAAAIWISAASVNVPRGPRYPMRATGKTLSLGLEG